ncbi:MAG: hypothetical protein B7Z55_05860 [Planctomycetales bacterium 12-60-4]|nr:MAG: hypothetical protein B7Z55_05860 [Planctomycetales bacterium 12-60-4]
MFDTVRARSRKALLAEEPFCLLPELQFACAAMQRLKASANPLDRSGLLTVLSGPAGAGKSMVVRQGLREACRDKRKQVPAILYPSDWHDLLSADPATNPWETWTEITAQCDMLACEDLDQLVTEDSLADQIARWLDELMARQVRIAITMSQPPGNCPQFSPRLTSRLRGGLIVRIAAGSADSRRQFLDWGAQLAHLSLTDDVRDWMAEQPPGSLRGLRSMLDRLQSEFPPPARINDLKAVQRLFATPAQRKLSLAAIASQVASEFGVSVHELRASSRVQAYRVPRQCAMMLAHEFAGFAMAEIGKYFGRRTHTSVSYSCRKFQDTLAKTPSLREHLRRLQAQMADDTLADCG